MADETWAEKFDRISKEFTDKVRQLDGGDKVDVLYSQKGFAIAPSGKGFLEKAFKDAVREEFGNDYEGFEISFAEDLNR